MARKFNMKTHKNLYTEICNLGNIMISWRKARKGKTKMPYVILFERDIIKHLIKLQEELKNKTYVPGPLEDFIIWDPKTRKISKAPFIDRIVHHLICKVVGPIFEKSFIYDSYSNRKGKGNLKAIERFDYFKRKVSKNGSLVSKKIKDKNFVKGYCLKADIRHYFEEVDHKILLRIIKEKIADKELIWLITMVIKNCRDEKGMPLGNLTSQFLANVYLNKFDWYVKDDLQIKYYIRYVDDFVILHESKEQLELWKEKINEFLAKELKLQLHPDKSRIVPLASGIDFVGFRNCYNYKLLRKRNIKQMENKIKRYLNDETSREKLIASFEGWNAYAMWGNSYKLRKRIVSKMNKSIISKEKLKL